MQIRTIDSMTRSLSGLSRRATIRSLGAAIVTAAVARPLGTEAKSRKKSGKKAKKACQRCANEARVTCESQAQESCASQLSAAQAECESRLGEARQRCDDQLGEAQETCRQQIRQAVADLEASTRESQQRACQDTGATICENEPNPALCEEQLAKCCFYFSSGNIPKAVACLIFAVPHQ